MNKTLIYSLIGAIVVCFGFGLFYLLKILPVQQSIAYSQSNIQMYRRTVAANQKAVLQGRKDLETRKKQIQKEEALGQKVSRSILPSSPDIEKFLTAIQEEADDLGVSVASISKAQGSGTGNAHSTANSSNKTTSGSKSIANRTKNLSSLLATNTYTLTLNADRELPVLTYLGYLEAQKRLLTIDNLNWQQNMTSGSSQTSSTAATSSGLSQASSGSTVDSSSSFASSTSSSNGSSAVDSAVTSGSSGQGSSTAAVPAQPKYTATLTLTLYSAKN